MGTMSKQSWMKKAAALSILPVTALGVTACDGTTGPEEGAAVEDIVEEDEAIEEDAVAEEADPALEPYDGAYDEAFYEEKDSYVGEEVTLSADVNEVIDSTSFTIAGTDDTTVEPLLIMHSLGGEDPDLSPELTVQVTGTVMEAFDLPTVEEEMGVDLDDALYEDWDGEPYVEASKIDTSVASDG